jgi:hypothetical protein
MIAAGGHAAGKTPTENGIGTATWSMWTAAQARKKEVAICQTILSLVLDESHKFETKKRFEDMQETHFVR